MKVDILGKITGQFLAHKSSTFRCLDLSRRVGREDIWRRKWEQLEQGEHNKPSGCSVPGPDYEEEETSKTEHVYMNIWSHKPNNSSPTPH